jgi:hypothetical protein
LFQPLVIRIKKHFHLYHAADSVFLLSAPQRETLDCESHQRFLDALGLTIRRNPNITRTLPMKVNPWRIIIPVVLVIAGAAILTAQGENPVMMIIAIAILALAICWIAFPLIVISKFNELLKVDREILDAQREIAKELQFVNSSQREVVKALQWIVDKLAVMK